MTLKKNLLSSLVHTTDHGVPGIGKLEMGRGPLGSSLIGSGCNTGCNTGCSTGCNTGCTIGCTSCGGSWDTTAKGAEVVTAVALGGSSFASDTGVVGSSSTPVCIKKQVTTWINKEQVKDRQ